MPHNDCHDPIAAATTDELLTELQKRFDVSFFVGVQDLDAQRDGLCVSYHGCKLRIAKTLEMFADSMSVNAAVAIDSVINGD